MIPLRDALDIVRDIVKLIKYFSKRSHLLCQKLAESDTTSANIKISVLQLRCNSSRSTFVYVNIISMELTKAGVHEWYVNFKSSKARSFKVMQRYPT